MSNRFDFREWMFRRARGAIEAYVIGKVDMNWVLGVLKGSLGVSKGETLMIISQLKRDKSFIWDSKRLERINELERRVLAEEWWPNFMSW
jgi:hypothetical protein